MTPNELLKLPISQISSGSLIDIEGIRYRELLNVRFDFSLKFLLEVVWSVEHMEEAFKVIDLRSSDRYNGYQEPWKKGLAKCTVSLLKDLNTRRAIIHFVADRPTCLMTVQFLVRNEHLEIVANFRSWEIEHFGPYNLCLLSMMAQEMSRHLGSIPLGTLHINVGSAHIILPN